MPDEIKKDEVPVETKEEYNPVKRIVNPHQKVSREVVESDLEHLISEAKIMLDICSYATGSYSAAHAMAHPQIEDKDPLRFFVTANGLIIINPVIINHTKAAVEKEEGCMSYPQLTPKMVKRFNKVTCKYWSVVYEEDKDGKKTYKLTGPFEDKLSGLGSQIVQHEISHLNGHYIYDEDQSNTHCLVEDNNKTNA